MIKTLEDVQYDPVTGTFTYAGAAHGNVNRGGYVVFRADSKVHYAHRVAWFKVHGVWPKAISHINGNRTDNRIKNLRAVDHAMKSQNAEYGKRRHFNNTIKPWKSSICAQTLQTLQNFHAPKQERSHA